jgi:hypothetical protein
MKHIFFWSNVLKQGLQVLFLIVMAKFPIPENCSAYVPMILKEFCSSTKILPPLWWGDILFLSCLSVRLSITQFVSATPLKLLNRISWILVGSLDWFLLLPIPYTDCLQQIDDYVRGCTTSTKYRLPSTSWRLCQRLNMTIEKSFVYRFHKLVFDREDRLQLPWIIENKTLKLYIRIITDIWLKQHMDLLLLVSTI